MADETNSRTRHTLAWYVGIALVALLFIYPLSLGPAVFVYTKFDLRNTPAGKTIEAVYKPLEDMRRHAPEPIGQAMDTYVGLFRVIR